MIIYKTINKVNGKFYVGQDSRNNPNYLGSGSLLKNAIKKYGRENFVKEILEECNSLQELSEREKYWIKETKAQELGYNISDGGFQNDFAWSEKQRKIHSDYMKNEFDCYSEEFLNKQKSENKLGNKNPMWGKTASEETRKRMSEAHKKNPVRYWLGKKQSAESNEKRRQASLKFRHTKEYKESIRGEGNYFYGKTHSEEARKKISESRKVKSPEQKLETYIKFHISRYGSEPSEEKTQSKLMEYRKMNNA